MGHFSADRRDKDEPLDSGRRSLVARLAYVFPPLLAGLVVAGVLIASIGAVERQLTTATLQSNLDGLADLRTRIESQLNQASNVSDALAAMIEVSRGMDRQRVIKVARRMLRRTPVIRSIGLAPENVVRVVVPLEGNEAALGLELDKHPVQKQSVEEAMSAERPILGGPYDLVQGGYAVIHRVPIFFDKDGDGKEDYWGLVSTPIDVKALFSRAGASEALANDQLAVRGYDGRGAEGKVFLGDAALFDDPGTLKTPVVALDGQWQLAMRPAGLPKPIGWLLRLAELLAVIVGVVMMWLTLRWQGQQRQLVGSERLLRDVTSNVSDVVFRTDEHGHLVFVSPAFERLSGCTSVSLLGKPWLRLFAESDRDKVRKASVWAESSSRRPAGGRIVLTTRLTGCGSKALPVELRVERVARRGNYGAGLVGTLTDLSERHAFEQLEELTTAMFEGVGDAIAILDRRRRVLAVNPAFERLVGIPAAELADRRLTTPEVLDRGRPRLETCSRILRMGERWTEEVACRLPDGSERILAWSVDLIRDERRRVRRYVCLISDVTVRHRRMQAMHHRALHDELTGVLNRAGLEERFEQARQHALREGRSIALAFVDLNGFKPINDTLGHHVGDEVLREVGRRLERVGRREDIVARLGGDEFVIAFFGVSQRDHMLRLGQTLQERVSEPMRVPGSADPVQVRASIGFACFPDDSDTLGGLMRRADAAMYEAKEQSDDSVVLRPAGGSNVGKHEAE